LSRFAGVSEALSLSKGERESAGEILSLSLSKGKDLLMRFASVNKLGFFSNFLLIHCCIIEQSNFS